MQNLKVTLLQLACIRSYIFHIKLLILPLIFLSFVFALNDEAWRLTSISGPLIYEQMKSLVSSLVLMIHCCYKMGKLTACCQMFCIVWSSEIFQLIHVGHHLQFWKLHRYIFLHKVFLSFAIADFPEQNVCGFVHITRWLFACKVISHHFWWIDKTLNLFFLYMGLVIITPDDWQRVVTGQHYEGPDMACWQWAFQN